MSEKRLNANQIDIERAESTDPDEAESSGSRELHVPDSSEAKADMVSETEDENNNSEQIAKVLASVIEQKFSGPIPPPNIIAGYENVVPGAADRIIRMAEQQSSHRQLIELMEAKAEVRDSLLGVVCAFSLGAGCLVACVVTVIMVPAAAGAICGSVLGVTGIGSIVTAFLKNTRRVDQ